MRAFLVTTAALATLALGAGGGAVAGVKIAGKDVKDSSLTGRDVRDGSLSSAEFAQTFTWRVAVTSNGAIRSRTSIPAWRIVTPVKAVLTNQRCGGSVVNNPEAAAFNVALVDRASESSLVHAPFSPMSLTTGALPDKLVATIPSCGGAVATGVLELTFEVRAGGVGKRKTFN